MKIKKIGASATHNMYAIIDQTGKTIGTKEVKLFGGVRFQAWASGYTARDIRRMFGELEG